MKKLIVTLIVALNFVGCAPSSSDTPLAVKPSPQETAIECYARNVLDQYGSMTIAYFNYANGQRVAHRSVCNSIFYPDGLIQ